VAVVHLVDKLAQERLSITVSAVAHARTAFEWTLDYCRERHAFGKPIGTFQHNRFKLAEMWTELEIAQLEPADAESFLADLGLKESGLDRVIRASYDLLGYVSFFTVGEDECRAWSIPRGTSAQLAAAEIHSDIARGFIRAEVVTYDALISRGTMAACRDHGEVRLEGKEYVVQDGDIINFRFAT